MTQSIERVAVLGAGTMGAAIAAHVANAGIPVLLLDIAPRTLNDKETKKGLTLDHPAVRNRIVRDGLARITKLKPASFMSEQAKNLVQTGNFEDDFLGLADVDWIVEAVVERLDIKRELMAKIDAVRQPGSLVTTNTSGLPIAQIIEGRSDDLRAHFFGTHFFNPPRYMLLLEIIAGEETDPDAVSSVATFAERFLGKGVVRCKDTPNFIGNRVMAIHGTWVMEHALSKGYRIEEVDAITGPLLGRPKTATFRLQDLVGLDITTHVAKNLHTLIPDDPQRDILTAPTVSHALEGLMERGHLGNKSGAGFYKKTKGPDGKPAFHVLDLETFDYRPAEKVRFAAVGAVRTTADTGDRLRTLFGDEWRDDRGAQLAWSTVSHFLGYAAECAQEVAFDLPSIDRAIRWGFSYQDGPFELWDRLGVAETAARMRGDGIAIASWVENMLDNDCPTFYRRDDQGRVTGYYDWEENGYVDLEVDPRAIVVDDLRADNRELESNASASLLDLGDGVLLLEFHAKMNAIDDDMVAMMGRATEMLDDDAWHGLVIGNDGQNFCVGANLMNVAMAVQQGNIDAVGSAIEALQGALQTLRYGSKPVVAAVHGRALGGGCEIAIGVDRTVAASEAYMGLVEVGVGLVPAGGGLKELVRRLVTPGMQVKDADPLPLVSRILDTVGTAKVSTSAAEARTLGFLDARDRIIMNRDRLLFEAKQEVLGMVADGYTPQAPTPQYAGGRDLLAALKLAVWSLQQAGWATEHDGTVVGQVAHVIAGGDGSSAQWVDESWFLKLERDAFVKLVQDPNTQARIKHMLETGKPLRN